MAGFSTMARDWHEWHGLYDEPGSYLTRRLAIVQQCIRDALDAAAPGEMRVLSMCAGEARDLAGVLADHPRRDDVRGRLVELDPVLAARAQAGVPRAVDVTGGDAGDTTAYEGAVPADLVLVCGVFGNVGDGDIVRTIELLPTLCAPAAIVIWTRHRLRPDRTVLVRQTFARAGFEEVTFVAPDGFAFTVGMHRLAAAPAPFVPARRLFEFVRA